MFFYKILILGLDGGEWSVIKRLIKKGKLPFFQRLLENGSYGSLLSTIPSLSAPAWGSFVTGLDPAGHGVFDFEDVILEKKTGVFKKTLVDSHSLKGTKFWEYLDRYRRKGAFINLPLTYPLPETKCLIVSSFLTPKNRVYCNQKKVYQYLEEIGYIIDPDFYFDQGEEKATKIKLEKELDKVFLDAKLKEKVALEFLKHDFDLFFLLFRGTDLLQHLFWGKKQVEEYYVLVDKIFEKLAFVHRRLYGKKSVVFIISDHGFHPMPKTQFNLAVFLEKKGFLKGLKEPKRLKLLRPFYRLFKGFLEKGFLSPFILKAKDKFLGKPLQEQKEKAFKKSELFIVQHGIYCKKEIKDKLKKALQNLKYQGKKVFSRVYFPEELYKGPYLEYLPDIVLLPSREFWVDYFPFKEKSKIFEPYKGALSGHHFAAQRGIFLGKGEPLKKGRVELGIGQILPLSLFLLGLPVPEKLNFPKNILKKQGKIKFQKEKDFVVNLIENDFEAL